MRVYEVTVVYMKIDSSAVLPGGQYAHLKELKFEVNDLRNVKDKFTVETAGDWHAPNFRDVVEIYAILKWKD